MEIRKVIYADEGKVLTNGEIYGKQIFLAEDMDETTFHEITDEEYNALVQQEKENYSNVGDPDAMR